MGIINNQSSGGGGDGAKGDTGPRGGQGVSVSNITTIDNNDGSIQLNFELDDGKTFTATNSLVSDILIDLNKLELSGPTYTDKLIVKNQAEEEILKVDTVNNNVSMNKLNFDATPQFEKLKIGDSLVVNNIDDEVRTNASVIITGTNTSNKFAISDNESFQLFNVNTINKFTQVNGIFTVANTDGNVILAIDTGNSRVSIEPLPPVIGPGGPEYSNVSLSVRKTQGGGSMFNVNSDGFCTVEAEFNVLKTTQFGGLPFFSVIPADNSVSLQNEFGPEALDAVFSVRNTNTSITHFTTNTSGETSIIDSFFGVVNDVGNPLAQRSFQIFKEQPEVRITNQDFRVQGGNPLAEPALLIEGENNTFISTANLTHQQPDGRVIWSSKQLANVLEVNERLHLNGASHQDKFLVLDREDNVFTRIDNDTRQIFFSANYQGNPVDSVKSLITADIDMGTNIQNTTTYGLQVKRNALLTAGNETYGLKTDANVNPILSDYQFPILPITSGVPGNDFPYVILSDIPVTQPSWSSVFWLTDPYSYAIIPAEQQFNGVYLNLAQVSSTPATLIVEYSVDTQIWMAINSVQDGTNGLSQAGFISWDINEIASSWTTILVFANNQSPKDGDQPFSNIPAYAIRITNTSGASGIVTVNAVDSILIPVTAQNSWDKDGKINTRVIELRESISLLNGTYRLPTSYNGANQMMLTTQTSDMTFKSSPYLWSSSKLGIAITGTSPETSLLPAPGQNDGSLTVPANFLQPSDSYHFNCSGICNFTVNNLQLTLKLVSNGSGGQVVLGTITTNVSQGTNQAWELEADFNIIDDLAVVENCVTSFDLTYIGGNASSFSGNRSVTLSQLNLSDTNMLDVVGQFTLNGTANDNIRIYSAYLAKLH
jgi:hypothetical protein